MKKIILLFSICGAITLLLLPNLVLAEKIDIDFTPILPKGKCLDDNSCFNNTFCDLHFLDQLKIQKLKAFCQTSPNCNLADDLVPSSFTVPLCMPKFEIGKECYKNEQCSSNNCNIGQGGEKKCMYQDNGGYLKVQPIAPTLEIKIPTLQPFTTEGLEKPDESGNIYFPFIGQYIVGIYKWMLLVAGIIATIMIILGGFTYLTSGGNATQAGQGKERISAAIFGLILLLGSYMLLYLINPGLVEFRSLKIKVIERKDLSSAPDFDTGADAASVSFQTTTKLGAVPCDAPEVNGLKKIPSLTGIQYVGAAGQDYLYPQVIEALKKAGELAAQDPSGGYTIVITTACRNMAKQTEIADKNPAGVALGTVAKKGGSPHGYGYAVDVFLSKNGQKLTDSIVSGATNGEQCKHPEVMNDFQKLASFFFNAGWVRLTTESWHFEYGTVGKYCRGNCVGYASLCNQAGAGDCSAGINGCKH